MDSSRCVRECRGEMIHSLSLFRQRVNSRPTMTDDDGSRLSALFGLAKISGFDPPLTTVWHHVHDPATLRRSFTHQSSWPPADHVADSTSIGGSTSRRSASPY